MNVNTNTTSYNPYDPVNAANKTTDVEETKTPEQIQAEIDALDQEIDELTNEAAKILEDNPDTVGPDGSITYPQDFLDKYNEIGKKYAERSLKQQELDKANGNEPKDPPVQEPFMGKIIAAMKDGEVKEKLKIAMEDLQEQLQSAWEKVRRSIVDAILASMGAGGSSGQSSSSSDSSSSSAASPMDAYTDIQKAKSETVETENTESSSTVEETENTESTTTEEPQNNT